MVSSQSLTKGFIHMNMVKMINDFKKITEKGVILNSFLVFFFIYQTFSKKNIYNKQNPDFHLYFLSFNLCAVMLLYILLPLDEIKMVTRALSHVCIVHTSSRF